MEGGRRQLRLLSRFLGKLRGINTPEKGLSTSSGNLFPTAISNSESRSTMTDDEEAAPSVTSSRAPLSANIDLRACNTALSNFLAPLIGALSADIDLGLRYEVSQQEQESVFRVLFPTATCHHQDKHLLMVCSSTMADEEYAAYSGQCLTPEQLPEFCNQLHHLVEVIRNIQSFGKTTGEYPSELERRLEEEARELAALAAEARNARDVVARTRVQRRAVRAQKKQLVAHLASLKETETRELESSIRQADRKLYMSWEALKESTDPAALESLMDEVKSKQIALDNMVRLIECRLASQARNASPPTLLVGAEKSDGSYRTSTDINVVVAHDSQKRPARTTAPDDQSSGAGKKRFDGSKRAFKKKRVREPRSVPLSGEPSRHGQQQQESESTRYSVASAAVALPPVELPSRGSYRDIIFFTVN